MTPQEGRVRTSHSAAPHPPGTEWPRPSRVHPAAAWLCSAALPVCPPQAHAALAHPGTPSPDGSPSDPCEACWGPTWPRDRSGSSAKRILRFPWSSVYPSGKRGIAAAEVQLPKRQALGLQLPRFPRIQRPRDPYPCPQPRPPAPLAWAAGRWTLVGSEPSGHRAAPRRRRPCPASTGLLLARLFKGK